MIVKMNKFAFLILQQEYKAFLTKLRNKGVVHIQERKLDENLDLLNSISNEISFVSSVKRELSLVVNEDDLPLDINETTSIEEVNKICYDAKSKISDYSLLRAKIVEKEQEIEESIIWGDFDKGRLDTLLEYGYIVDFVIIPRKEFETIKDNNIVEITSIRGNIHCVWIHKEDDKQPLENMNILSQFPKDGYIQLEKEKHELKNEENRLLQELNRYYIIIDKSIDKYLSELENKYNFNKALLMGEDIIDGKIIYLEGWIPEGDSRKVVAELEEESYFVKPLEISFQDHVPIKLKNNFFSRLFEPITAMFSMPNYNEIDQTALLAPFFMLFFGMCFGDGGYGLLLFIVSSFLRIYNKSINKNILKLLQWLGGSAFVVGMLMGTFFGVVMPYAKPESYFLNQNNLMVLSVIIGIIQIIFAKIIAAYKTKIQKGFKYSLAQFAWVIFLIIIIVYFTLSFVVENIPLFVNYIIYTISAIALLVVFFYNSPGKNPFLNFGIGIWNSYNMASGLLGDTLSYIRLFAIGLTGSILGGVFNQLAIVQTEGLNIFARIPLAIFILLVGHSINIGLAMIGSLVHPLRLTFVEFYKNSEFEGGGKLYNPFKEK